MLSLVWSAVGGLALAPLHASRVPSEELLPAPSPARLTPAAPPAEVQNPATPAPPAADEWTITWSWKDGIRFQTENGRVKGRLGGRLHWDASWLALDGSLEDAGFDDSDGTEFRRARVMVDLDVDGLFVKAEYDFAGQDVDFNDVWVGLRDAVGSADLKVGHMKEPFHLDYLTSANYITFLERSLLESLTLGRNTGVMLSGNALGDAAAWAIGGFKQADDAGTNAMDGNYAVTGRVAGTPLYRDEGETLLHLGAAYSVRDLSSAQFRQRPEIHLAPFLLDTGALPTEDVSYGNLELAGVLGAFHFQAEYAMADASGASGAEDFEGAGWYGQVGWFLTGETRPYRRGSGTFDRVVPRQSYGDDGHGAVELALRYSTVDLTDGGVVGGEQDNVTLGVNWYVTPNLRLSANYVTGSVDLGAGLDDEDVSALLTRVQVDW